MTNTFNKRFVVCLSLVLLCFLLLMAGWDIPSAYAAENLISAYDKTNVLDDLKSSTVDGQPFSLMAYPYNEYGSVKLVNLVEFCYSYRANAKDNFALYLYIYNPQNLTIDTDSKQNKVQIGIPQANGETVSYDKFTLLFCNKSTGNYNNLFYKFRVLDKKVDGKTLVERVSSNERRYDISGVELVTKGDHNATEYGIGGKYSFTGYAAGLGPDTSAASTLTCNVQELETLTLKVHHVNYRTNVSSLGKSHFNEVNSVYFALPQRVFDEYGTLQKIHAEWWEYKTKMAAITSNYNYYLKLLQYVGTDLGGTVNGNVPLWLYSDYTGSAGTYPGAPSDHNYGWSYNKFVGTTYTSLGTVSAWYTSKKISTILPYAFYAPSVDIDSVFSFLYTKQAAGAVEGTVVQQWIYDYSNNLGHGYIDCNGRKISKDLFEDSVDEGRTMGYNNVNVDFKDTFNLSSYDSNHSWWDKLRDYGFSWPKTNGDYHEVAPIYFVQASDLLGTNEKVGEKLLVDKDSVAALKNFYTEQTAKGNKVVLFRFANTDYYSAPAYTENTTALGGINKTDTYVAQQTVFFDFDIIDLTFYQNGTYKVIPVVSSPTDIINGFTPPPEEFQWWKVVLAVVLLILLVVLLYPILPYVFKALWWIICLPFKAIAALVKACGNAKIRHQERKDNKALREKEKAAKRKAQEQKRKERNERRKKSEPEPTMTEKDREELEAYLDSIDWDSIDWNEIDNWSE